MSTKFQNIHYKEPKKNLWDDFVESGLVFLFNKLRKETWTTFCNKPFVNIIGTSINYYFFPVVCYIVNIAYCQKLILNTQVNKEESLETWIIKVTFKKPLNSNPTKWPNHFVGLTLKWLKRKLIFWS